MLEGEAVTIGPPVDALRAAILSGEYLPGERLVEADLCERLQTSRFNVRSALQKLSDEGLVEVLRNKGAHVRKVSLAQAIELNEARQVLEGLVAGRAALKATAAQAEELREIGAAMRAAVTEGEWVRYSELNRALHLAIRQIAAHGTADLLLKTLRGQLMRHHLMLSLVPGRPVASLPEHERIIAAIVAHDEAEAEAAMRDHIASVTQTLRTMGSLPGVGY